MTLILEDGDCTGNLPVPLERLEVVEVEALKGEGKASNTVPKRPSPGQTSFRLAVIADTGVTDTDRTVKGALTKLVNDIKPEVVVHLGGQSDHQPVVSNFGHRLDELRDHLNERT